VKTTRQRIMEFLQFHRHASAAELSRALHVTAANIRHHLSILEEEGVVAVTGQRPASGRGRPVNIFALSQQASLHNLDRLASSLLRCWQAGEKEAPPLKVLAAAMLEDGAEASSSQQKASSQTRRLTQAVDRLNEMNYQARWEAHASGPRLIFGHCPYLSILDRHPEMCRLDAFLLEEMLGVKVVQQVRREPNPQGLPQCVFVLTDKKHTA
jgi:predicted ArsR family transcriptional regulator